MHRLPSAIRISLFAAALAVLGAQQAAALSCIRPNLARSFNWYQDSEDTYVIGVGKLTAMGKVPDYVRGKPRTVEATFEGGFLNRSGVMESEPQSVSIETLCLASWCGGIPETARDMLVFFKKTDDGLVLETSPCPGGLKVKPSDQDLRLLRSCLAKGKCSEATITKLDK